jgi:hypothetical protein
MRFDGKAIAKLPNQIVTGHHAAGEIVLGDPVVLVVSPETIRCVSVTEDMHEHSAVRIEAIAHAPQ